MSYKDIAFCPAKDCRNLDCIRNTNRPDIQPDEFRKLLAMRCLEELSKPVSRKRTKDEPAKAGYILEEFPPE